MKLLVSPKNFEEAEIITKSKVDILDIKNPAEGSLGGQFPWIIKKIKNIIPKRMEMSAAVCDSINKPGLICQALYGLFEIGVDYVKVGLHKPSNEKDLRNLLIALSNAKKEFNFRGKLVIAGYADWNRAKSINPLILPNLIQDLDIDVLMIDTFIKDGKNLFDFMEINQLKEFIDKNHEKGLLTALAGKIQLGHLKKLKEVNCDIVGVRSLVCENQDRLNGKISTQKIDEILNLI